MCDYSLSGVPNRRAVEGERLITYRFPNGVTGFVSQPEAAAFECEHGTLWSRVRAWFRSDTPCAVCLPAGATLVMRDVPAWIRGNEIRGNETRGNATRGNKSSDADQVATFTQNGSAFEYRDAIEFPSGTRILIQQFGPGQVADVLSVAPVGVIERPADVATEELRTGS